jgi:hypothetical protein
MVAGMKGKLEGTSARGPFNGIIESVGAPAGVAFELSAPVLARDRAQLCSQLIARLADRTFPVIRAIVDGAMVTAETRLRPRFPSLQSPEGTLQQTLRGHDSDVRALALTHNGRRLVSGSADRTLRVWDLQVRAEFRVLAGHTAAVRALGVSSDGTIVTASGDGTARRATGVLAPCRGS